MLRHNLNLNPARWRHRCSSALDSMLRVDHAGEFGADRIYCGQYAVLGKTSVGPKIKEMWEQEIEHKQKFEKLVSKHGARPSALLPLWWAAGYALGAGTALMGPKAAMACTVAVETVIVEHYNEQLRELVSQPDVSSEVLETIQKFRDDEQEHHDTGIKYGAEEAPFYEALTSVIKSGCHLAIKISKVI